MNLVDDAPRETSLESGGSLKGVAIAVVTQNKDDDGLCRVKVSFPWHEKPSESYWARLVTPMAGAGRGLVLIPEVGDEVLVGFEREDLRFPYVLGALWNATDTPPAEPVDTVKLIRSRNGLTIRMRDDNTSLIIETPAGQRITLQDNPRSVRVEDANGNAVTLAPSGVTISASASVTIAAAAKVTLNASSVELNAGTLNVNAGSAHFSGVVQCDTLISNSVVSAKYSPGAGNVW